MRPLISLAAMALRCARLRTSEATTARAAFISRACRLYRGVHCQDVGLEGDFVNGRYDVGNPGRSRIDLRHCGDSDGDDVLPLQGGVLRAIRKMAGLGGIVGAMPHRHGTLLQPRRSL